VECKVGVEESSVASSGDGVVDVDSKVDSNDDNKDERIDDSRVSVVSNDGVVIDSSLVGEE